MTESIIQNKLVNALKKAGYIVNKPVGNSVNGWPDVQAYQAGQCIFIECKQPGKKLTKLQVYRMEQLRKEGFKCFVYDGFENVNELIERFNFSEKPYNGTYL